MNSFRFHSSNNMAKSSTFAALALGAALFATGAYAQEPAAQPFNLPSVEDSAESAPVRLPQGASIDGSRERVRNMATEAGRSLDDLIGNAVSDRTEAEVGAMAERKRNIDMLKLQLEEAELAKELWVVLNGESEASSEEVSRITAERDELIAQIEQMSRTTTRQREEPMPVVVDVTGGSGGMRATILVPYVGEVVATRGTVLANGMTVSVIDRSGVTVDDGGVKKGLAFGTSVPKNRNTPAGGSNMTGTPATINQIAR